MDDNLLVLFMAFVILTMGFSYMYKNKPGTTSYDAVIRDLKNKMEVLNGAIKITDKKVNIGGYDTPYQFSVGKMWGINSVNDDTGGSHTTIYRNTIWDNTKGFVNANPGSCSQIAMGGGSAGVGFIRLYAGSTAQFSPAGTPAGLNGIFINSSGNVGIGTESPERNLHIIATKGTPTNNLIPLLIEGHSTNSDGTIIKLRRNNNAISTTLQPIANVGEVIAQIQFEGVNNSANPVYNGPSAIIQAIMDSPYGTDRPPGAIAFRTSQGSGSLQKMRISSSGNVAIGNEFSDPSERLHISDGNIKLNTGGIYFGDAFLYVNAQGSLMYRKPGQTTAVPVVL